MEFITYLSNGRYYSQTMAFLANEYYRITRPTGRVKPFGDKEIVEKLTPDDALQILEDRLEEVNVVANPKGVEEHIARLKEVS